MHKLLEKLDKELHKYADKEGELSKTEWDAVFNAIEARYQLIASMTMEGEDKDGNYDSGESMRGYSRRGYSGGYSGGRMMEPDYGYSYRGGNGGNGGSSQRRYSGNGNYSGHGNGQQKMLNNLYEAMESAESEEERQMIQKCINKLEY